MKKIALISVHNDPNYGSALQAYALAYAIRREGYDCEYINYTASERVGGIVSWIKSIAKIAIIGLSIKKSEKTEYFFWRSSDFKIQRQQFTDFHNVRIPFSQTTYTPINIKNANTEYDCFIVGSDQTWSPYVARSKSSLNFLDFVEPGKLRGSYAPSFGTCHLSEKYITFLKEKIIGFDFLSCREKKNAELLTEFLGKKVEHVLDPTFLLSPKEWLQISEPIVMPEKFLLCYILGTKQSISDFAEKLGKEHSLPVYYIVTRPEYLNKTNALKNVSPGQFITLIYKALYVVTDSFHGLSFSINFQRQFYAFTKRSEFDIIIDNDRIGDLLSTLGMEERLNCSGNNTFSSPIEYASIKEDLAAMLISSKTYLSRLLSAVKQ